MKKLILAAVAAFTLILTGCGSEDGTYYPDSTEMRSNLEGKGYTVSVETGVDEFGSTLLTAEKKDEFIEFYWLVNGENAVDLRDKLNEKHPDHEKSVCMTNDVKFGNIVFCSSKKGFKDSGIKIVEVKV